MTFESKRDKNAVINIGQHVYVIFCSGLELKKCHIAVSKPLGILLNIRRGGNNARVLVKTASSAAIIVYLVGVSMNCDSLYGCYDM